MPYDPDDRQGSGAPTLHSLDKSIGILQTKLDGFIDVMKDRLTNVDTTIKESLGTYATKAEMKERDEAIAEIRGNIKWAVRLVISFVILTVLGVAFKIAVSHG